MTDTPSMIITGLFHDIARHRSIVSLVWSNDPEKQLGLDVPKAFSSEVGTGSRKENASNKTGVAWIICPRRQRTPSAISPPLRGRWRS